MLYRVFDEACRLKSVSPESGEASELALSILALHNAGMVDEQVLLAAVAFRLHSYEDPT